MSHADALIDAAIKKKEAAGGPPIEATTSEPSLLGSTPPVEETKPEVIGPNDPEGRQPGNPDDFIELPPELLTTPPLSGVAVVMLDTVPTIDDFNKLEMTVQRPERPVSDQTFVEMQAGRQRLAEAQDRPVVTPAASTPMPLLPVPPAEVPVEPRPMSAATLAELEAGRMAVARKQAEIERNRAVMARIAAEDQAKNKPPSNDDLSYTKNQ